MDKIIKGQDITIDLPDTLIFRRFYVYGLVIVIWAAISAAIINLEFTLERQKIDASFNQRVARIHERIKRISNDNEAILEGFSAFLGANEYVDRESASRYARQILSRYSQVYQLGAALVVKRSELAAFVSRQKLTWFPKFKVQAFNLSTGLSTTLKKNKPIFLPVIFIEPGLGDSKKKIGMDMDSEALFRDALYQSLETQSMVASVPFNFSDGPREYMLFYPVPDSPKESPVKRKPALVLLEVNAESIRNEIETLADDLDLRVHHANYASDDPHGLLFHIANDPVSLYPWESKLFPKLTAEKMVEGSGQPFKIKAVKQLKWYDLNLPLLISTGTTTLFSLALLLMFLSGHYQREKQRKANEIRLHHMVMHDALTGLPNRTLLADRFNQASARAQRHNTSFSIVFLDLNKFKKVNDSFGHETGDKLLKTLGSLLKQCIRAEDTLSRISGDEFVIILEDTPYEKAEHVCRKIQARLEKPVNIGGVEMTISVSHGIATYSKDGKTMSELIRKADERMYKAKERAKYERLV